VGTSDAMTKSDHERMRTRAAAVRTSPDASTQEVISADPEVYASTNLKTRSAELRLTKIPHASLNVRRHPATHATEPELTRHFDHHEGLIC
jgi:hypothetical protein